MKMDITKKGDSESVISVTATKDELDTIRRQVFNLLRQDVKAAGFRPGKAPDDIVERSLGTQRLHNEFVEAAASRFYNDAVRAHEIRPLEPPHVEIKKFVPYGELELVMTVEVTPDIKLADYKKIKKKQDEIDISDKEITDVIEGLRIRAAKRTDVERPAKNGDEVVIDFTGTKDGQPVRGASAKDYHLQLGSGRFVKGFEEALVGAKLNETRAFDVTFPKDYLEKFLQGQQVHFEVSIKKVQELSLPGVDDKLAKQLGPFENLEQLKKDVKRQVRAQKEQEARVELENDVLTEVIEGSKFPVPPKLLKRQLETLVTEFDRNLQQQGSSLGQYLEENKTSREKLEQELKPNAERRVRSGLVLSEVAKQEGITLTDEELDLRIQVLKGQYQDKKMQEEFNKPQARREIADQLMVEKTVAKLIEYATK